VRLANKVALVTGGAAGLGLGMVERFAAEGASVIMVDRDAQRGHAETERLRSGGANIHFIQADLAEADAPARIIENALAAHPQLDILVNNAAVFLQKPLEEIAIERWDWLMAVNLRAPMLLAQAALTALKASKGNILNISSTAALKVFSPNLTYITAKAGLIAMTKCLAQELKPYGIRANCICPGAVDTPALHRDLEIRGAPAGALENLAARGLLTTPQEVAAVALSLVSEDGAVMTGSVVVADGGAMLF
jgi:NAD(P)-dependent dehydrogenase (short-subunit alcohol dehydrogenase family)